MNTATISVQTPSNIIPIPIQPPVETVLTLPTPAIEPAKTGKAKCDITVCSCKVRDKVKWYVRHPVAGKDKPKRSFFDTEDQANSYAGELKGETLTNRKKLSLLPASDADMLMVIYNEAHKRGIALTRVFSFCQTESAIVKVVPTFKRVLELLLQEMRDTHKDEDYIDNFEQTADRFGKGMEEMPIDKFTVEHLNTFLAGKSPGYVVSLRRRISTIFRFAIRMEYITANPCSKLSKLSKKATQKTPDVFELKEAKTCLEWLVKNPKGLAWFISASFAGLRPQDEACLTGWEKIRFNNDPKKQMIIVEAEVSKTGKRRVVYAQPMVFAWLKWAKENGAQLPISYNEIITIQRKMREILGWPEWKQDVTRHSASTYWVASTHDVKKVSRSLGHSLATMDSKYDARRTEEEGIAYYGLTVDKFVKVK